MKTTVALLLLTVLISSCVFGQITQPSDLNLKGNVQSFNTSIYTPILKREIIIDKKKWRENSFIFNEKGKVLEYKSKTEGLPKIVHHTFNYNSQDSLIKECYYGTQFGDWCIGHSYNTSGRKELSTSTSLDGRVFKQVYYCYNENELNKLPNASRENSLEIIKQFCKYNDENKLIEEVVYMFNMHASFRYDYV